MSLRLATSVLTTLALGYPSASAALRCQHQIVRYCDDMALQQRRHDIGTPFDEADAPRRARCTAFAPARWVDTAWWRVR